MVFFTNIQENLYLSNKTQTVKVPSPFGEGYITIPLVPSVNLVQNSGPAGGTVPIVENKQPDIDKGVVVEKTAPPTTTETAPATDPAPKTEKPAEGTSTVETPKTTQEEKPAEVKKPEEPKQYDKSKMADRRDITDVMKRNFPKLDWDNMTEEDKQKKIISFLESTKEEKFNYCGGRVGWLKSFLVNNKNMDESETKLVVGALKYLNVSDEELAELQSKGVKLTAEEKAVNKETAQIQVVQDMPKYCIKGQKTAVDVTSTSVFDNVKVEGSKRASELHEDVQTYAVEKYMDGSKDNKDLQKQIGIILVDQYGKYAEKCELGIHKILSSSDIKEIVNHAAEKIGCLHQNNQAGALEITKATGNTEAITAAEYSITHPQDCSGSSSASSSPYSSVPSSGYESTNYGDTNTEAPKNKNSDKTSSIEEIEKILQEKSIDVKNLKDKIKILTDVDKINLLKSHPDNMDLIFIILNSNPSLAVLSALSEIFKDDKSINRIKKYNDILGSISFLSAGVQLGIVKEAVTSNLTAKIDVNKLNPSVRTEYNELLKQNEGK